jgi:hypothetical protein
MAESRSAERRPVPVSCRSGAGQPLARANHWPGQQSVTSTRHAATYNLHELFHLEAFVGQL